jgi:flagella basal body P-ring formation protein FlgA
MIREFQYDILKKLLPLLLTGGLLAPAHAAEVSEDVIREKVVTHVLETLKPVLPENGRVTVNVLKIPGAPFNFPEAKQVNIELNSPLGEMYSDRAIVRVRLDAAPEASREVGVPIEIKVWKPVWVVKNTVLARQPLRRSDFELQERDVSRNCVYMVGPEKSLHQYVARVNLRSGEMLDSRKITIPPDVRYNDEVRIFLKTASGMTISVPGVALGDARIGDIVRVRQSHFQRKYYMAKVIDKHRVLVEM